MSSVSFKEVNYSGLKVLGTSVAGVGTCFILPEIKLCFDVAQGLPPAFNLKHYLITHGHMDHAAGIPYIISQKCLTHQAPGTFYMPEVMVEPLTKIMRTWEKLEGHQYDLQFIPVQEDQFYEISNEYSFKIFPTLHRIPSNGYVVYRKNKKLKPEFTGKSKNEIIKIRESGVEVNEYHFDPLIAFTGDTKIEFLENNPWLKDVKTLMMEVTYVDSKKPVSAAREWGHIHLDELLPLLPNLNCEKVVITHISSRHRQKEVEDILDSRLSGDLRHKIEVFPL